MTVRLFTVPYFSVGSLSSTGCHLGLTGKSTKCPWVGLVEVTAGGINRETVTASLRLVFKGHSRILAPLLIELVNNLLP